MQNRNIPEDDTMDHAKEWEVACLGSYLIEIKLLNYRCVRTWRRVQVRNLKHKYVMPVINF